MIAAGGSAGSVVVDAPVDVDDMGSVVVTDSLVVDAPGPDVEGVAASSEHATPASASATSIATAGC